MKIYIQSNQKQYLASKVSSHSFNRFGYETHIMKVEDYQHLNNNFGNSYLRSGKVKIFKNDLQSFTLLRFLAPQLNSYSDYILVIDPDVFAIKNPNKILKYIDDKHDIFCTFKNNLPRSEMMLINAKKVRWNFKKILNQIFNKNLDYSDLMNLKFDNNIKIKQIPDFFNDHDQVNENTIILHTTNRITQPWKEDLKIDFERHNYSFKSVLINFIKKIFGLKHDKYLLLNKYQKHPNQNVIDIVKELFKNSIDKGVLSHTEVENGVRNFEISRKII